MPAKQRGGQAGRRPGRPATSRRISRPGHPDLSARLAGWEGRDIQSLHEFYGKAAPQTAHLLESYLRSGHIPVRDPDGAVVTVDLGQAAAEFGGDLRETRCYLHRLHATGLLKIDDRGVVELP